MSRTAPRDLRPGRLFRSGELSRLDDDGRATLLQLGITDVADLRATREVARRGPGLVPDGMDIHLLPMPDLGDDATAEAEAPHESAFRKLFEGAESPTANRTVPANLLPRPRAAS